MEDEERVMLEKESKKNRETIMGSTETSVINNDPLMLEKLVDKLVDAEVQQAASTLVLMSKQILDSETAEELRLQVMKTKYGRKIGGNKLPRFPQVEGLNGVIGNCSVPFEKQLTSSDVSEGLCRLSLTREEVIDSILPLLNSTVEDVEVGIPVTVYDSVGKGYEMTFRSWNNSKLYVLKQGWIKFCKDHNLRVQDWVSVWMFRHKHTRNLCFVLTFKRGD
ncbi:hypothetical protein ACH5RR_004426 [Cinchona calisaya]|uniref:TF-B3 domain-containing protein n=1 Tax=Cinchona calisaya TaxID=153742 RepID=A0ABD3AXL0_9GENT